jgi:hypothetical protein
VIDAVLTYHTNPMACGVTKFNQQLADKLGVPMLPLTPKPFMGKHALVSIKASEIGPGWEYILPPGCTLLLHDRPNVITCSLPRQILYAEDLGCPSTVQGNPTRGAYRVLTFGMANKLQLSHFTQLKAQLESSHPDFTIELSTAVHEGHPWDEALMASVESMRGIFGDRLRVLGFLGDDALARLLEEVNAVALFYSPALRANNTSYWAALEAGKTIYTNRDEHSPKEGDPSPTWERIVEQIRA